MDIITQKELFSKSFFLFFWEKNADGTEWIDYNLPIPTLLEHTDRGIWIGWALDGYFHTQANKDYLNDIIARYLITFKDLQVTRLGYNPFATQDCPIKPTTHFNPKHYKLKEFNGLESIVRAKSVQQRADNFHDHTFWAIKFYCEDLIIQQGMATYSDMLDFALRNFEHKERSTLRAKVRSIWNWYEQRDWEIPNKPKYRNINHYLEETMASRKDHMKKLNANKKESNKKKIQNTITGIFGHEYKKKNGSWNVTKIARDLGLHRETVATHLKELS